MIIVGNSHVSVFSGGCAVRGEPDVPVEVHWVGALEIEHFYKDHPAARKVRSLVAEDAGWVFLMMGNHDIFRLVMLAGRHGRDAAFDHLLGRYREVFLELAARGRLVWLVGPQQADNVTIPGVRPEDILDAAREFVARLSAWCEEQGIPVVDPLPAVSGLDGRPEPRWLQADGLHLKPSAARFYFEAIRARLGLELETRHAAASAFEPVNEHESFCSLVLQGLELAPDRRSTGDVELQEKVLAFARGRLADRGIVYDLTPDTDFVDAGLFDSLDLVEMYAHATEALGLDLDFDVSLRELETLRKLCAYLESRSGSSGTDDLVMADFIQSMRGPADAEATQEAEARIARMGQVRADRLLEGVTTAGGVAVYGRPLAWIALAYRAQGRQEEAERLLAQASRAGMRFPLDADRVAQIRRRWALEFVSPSARAVGPDTEVARVLPDAKGRNFLLDATDPALLEAWVKVYLATFTPSDDVALHLFVAGSDAEMERLAARIVGISGTEPDAMADLVLHPGAGDRAQVAVADLVLGTGTVARIGRELGRPVCAEPADWWSPAPGAGSSAPPLKQEA